MNWHEQVRQSALGMISAKEGDTAARLNGLLRLLSKWRSAMIQNTVLRRQGTIVQEGPVRGLDFLPRSAEGYYAVGMARHMPQTRMVAFDLNPAARQVCAGLAEKNGVQDRIEIGERFQTADFERYAGERVFVLCDIEGGEEELLRPDLAPALRGFDLIVEAHDSLRPGMTALLKERFAQSHKIEVVTDNGQRSLPHAPKWFADLAHLDQLLAVWEWRTGPTPWLVMHAREVQS